MNIWMNGKRRFTRKQIEQTYPFGMEKKTRKGRKKKWKKNKGKEIWR